MLQEHHFLLKMWIAHGFHIIFTRVHANAMNSMQIQYHALSGILCLVMTYYLVMKVFYFIIIALYMNAIIISLFSQK